MATRCTPAQLQFQALGRRDVIGRFAGGRIMSDDGGGFGDECGLSRRAPPLPYPTRP